MMGERFKRNRHQAAFISRNMHNADASVAALLLITANLGRLLRTRSRGIASERREEIDRRIRDAGIWVERVLRIGLSAS